MELCHLHQNIRPIAETPRYQCRIQMPIMPRVLQCNKPHKMAELKYIQLQMIGLTSGI